MLTQYLLLNTRHQFTTVINSIYSKYLPLMTVEGRIHEGEGAHDLEVHGEALKVGAQPVGEPGAEEAPPAAGRTQGSHEEPEGLEGPEVGAHGLVVAFLMTVSRCCTNTSHNKIHHTENQPNYILVYQMYTDFFI